MESLLSYSILLKMSTMPLSLKSKQSTSSVNGTCESLWIMLRRIFKVQISKDQDGKDSAQGNGRQSCAGEVEGCMLSHDCESRGSFPWVWWCFSCSPLSLIFTAEDYESNNLALVIHKMDLHCSPSDGEIRESK